MEEKINEFNHSYQVGTLVLKIKQLILIYSTMISNNLERDKTNESKPTYANSLI